MKIFVTGCAGFIGSSMVDRLLANGHNVVGFDNLSTGQIKFMEAALLNENFQFVENDILNFNELLEAISECEFVYHFSANADVRFGLNNPRRDFEQNTLATQNLLEAMRIKGIKKIAFSSTGSVYGDAKVIPTPENAPLPLQTSLYGASKLACEGLISAYCEGFGFQAWIFRFVSILGERYTHGHVIDFYRQLISNRHKLSVLGDGHQKKSYLYIGDCLDAVLLAIDQCTNEKVNIFNLGSDDYSEVNDSIKWTCEELYLAPEISYSGGDRGWVGDSPFIYLDTKKIRSLGWSPKVSIHQSIVKTVKFLKKNEWIFKARS
jgi:UDP-glucose 4-epimerase